MSDLTSNNWSSIVRTASSRSSSSFWWDVLNSISFCSSALIWNISAEHKGRSLFQSQNWVFMNVQKVFVIYLLHHFVLDHFVFSPLVWQIVVSLPDFLLSSLHLFLFDLQEVNLVFPLQFSGMVTNSISMCLTFYIINHILIQVATLH